jgi:hypothetical protein
MNYTDLQTAVVSYYKRGSIATSIPAWIALAEAYLFRELDVKSLSVVVTGTTTGGLITVPADFLSVVRLTVTQDGTERKLDYIPAPSEGTETGMAPYGYSVQGEALRLHPPSGTGQAYTLHYTPKVEALSGTNPTNWILENAADLYLYATCWQGACEMKNAAEEAKLMSIVRPLIDSTRSFALRRGVPTSGGMRIRPRGAV